MVRHILHVNECMCVCVCRVWARVSKSVPCCLLCAEMMNEIDGHGIEGDRKMNIKRMAKWTKRKRDWNVPTIRLVWNVAKRKRREKSISYENGRLCSIFEDKKKLAHMPPHTQKASSHPNIIGPVSNFCANRENRKMLLEKRNVCVCARMCACMHESVGESCLSSAARVNAYNRCQNSSDVFRCLIACFWFPVPLILASLWLRRRWFGRNAETTVGLRGHYRLYVYLCDTNSRSLAVE